MVLVKVHFCDSQNLKMVQLVLQTELINFNIIHKKFNFVDFENIVRIVFFQLFESLP